MNSTNDRARLESALARAHRALYDAQGHAERLGDVQGHDQLYSCLLAVGGLMERSLSKRPNAALQWQLDLLARDTAT